MRAASDNRVFVPTIMALIAVAWFSLFLWGRSPYRGYLSHEQLDGAVLHSGPTIALLIAGWTLMIVAMMLPTTLPLLTLFRRMTRNRADGLRLMVVLMAGYLAIWVLFGVLVHLLDLGMHRMVVRSALVADHVWVLGAGTLIVAGAYQFTALKYHCLDRCRSPLGFIATHWSGRAPERQALEIGVHHGVFCVGCCWSLMLLMFAVGAGNLGWMLLLGAVMAIEKNMPWGRSISAPLGITLLAGGVLLAGFELSA